MAYVASITIAVLKKKANGTQHYPTDGSRECVAVVRHFCNAPHTSLWVKGALVRGNTDIKPGTAIATFTAPNGGYRGHAAIYEGQDSSGIQVLDQWNNLETGKFKPRPIRFNRPANTYVSNNGDLFYVVE